MLMNRNVVAPTTVEHNQESPTSAAPTMQPRRCSPASAVPISAAPSSVPRNDAPPCPHSELVIFLSVLQY